MWVQKPFFKYASGIILILLIIYLLGKIDYFLWPLQNFVIAIFFPVLISGLFYYLLRKPVRWLSNYMPRIMSILIIFFAGIMIFTGFFYFSGSLIFEQVSNISSSFPAKIEELTKESEEVMKESKLVVVDAQTLKQKLFMYIHGVTENLGKNIMKIFSLITSIATVLVVIPFLVFFFLKDEKKLRPYILKRIPTAHEQEGNKILKDIDRTLFTYVTGQFIIALVDGVLMYIGYKIIGLNYALLLAIFTMLFTVVPFVGPVIGVIPAVFVGMVDSPIMVFKILIVLLVVQQLEGNFVTPHVMSKKLNIHPITVILLLIAAGSIYGFIGILISIPLYSVVKIIIKDIFKLYKLRKKKHFIHPEN